MKVNVLILLMTVFMVVFVIGAFQTWEFAVDHGIPIPWQVWGVFVIAVLWSYLLYKMPKRRKEIQDEAQAEIDRFNQSQEINPLLLINIVLKF